MKRTTLINLLLVGWLMSLILSVILIISYIDSKSNRLHMEIRENIEKIFNGQSSGDAFVSNDDGFFDVDYSGYRVKHYKRIAIPSKPTLSNNLPDELAKYDERIKDQWLESYGDLASLYSLNWGDEYPNNHDDGWTLIRIHCGGTDDDIIQTNAIFPYQVGLKRTEWGNYFTVEDAVNAAYKFYTTDEQSSYANRFQKGSINRIWSEIYDCCNEYYGIVRNENFGGWIAGRPIVKNVNNLSYEEIQRKFPYENGWMHNGFYRVFIAATQETHYKIEKYEWAISSDRNSLLLWWSIGITIIFLSIIILLKIIQNKDNQRKRENLYQRLCRLCNPKEFVANYNKEKLDIANDIYKSLMNIDKDNQEELSVLANRAVFELGISLLDDNDIAEMREKANPANYMKPYDPDKVTTANEVYSLLDKQTINYEDYINIKSLLEKL